MLGICLRWGDTGPGDDFGGTAKSIWHIRVNSSRIDTHIIHLEFSGRARQGPRNACGINDWKATLGLAGLSCWPAYSAAPQMTKGSVCYVVSNLVGYLPK